jgi:transcriptional regulator with XRE-family HTH domain
LNFDNQEQKYIQNEAKYLSTLMDLREVRKKVGLTQDQLAQKSGIPRPAITNIENGNRNTTIATLQTIANAMGKRLEVRFE